MSGCVRVSETAELEAANMVGFLKNIYIFMAYIYIVFDMSGMGCVSNSVNFEGLLVEPHPAPEQQ